jgi:3-oxoacyl-[acyl-carrier protein] reductase
MPVGSLHNRSAVVTGASRAAGIGSAIARALAQAGAQVFIAYYRAYDQSMPWGSQPHEVEALLNELGAGGIEIDLSEPAAPAKIMQAAVAALGHVDILVNNHTLDIQADIYQISADLLDRHYTVNLRATTLLCAEFARLHDGRPGGRIINLTSGQGHSPMPDNLPYAITKGSIDALTTSLSPTLAKKGITSNAIDPGPTDTGWMTPDLLAQLAASAPMGRVGLPRDAANLAVFLASDEAQWITGQILRSRGSL